jgi:class 3 adenylate cyclase
VVLIEAAWEHDRPLEVGSAPTFDHAHNTLRFRFVGSSLTDPAKVRYRYRLNGLEDAWTESTHREARYPALPPGSYLFEVAASNNDGLWSPDPARFSFSILPPWWATWWFRALYLALIFLSGFAVYAVRATTLRRQKRRLERLVTERTAELQSEKEKSEALLLNILPAPIADELKEKGVASTRLYPDVTILFTDFQDFTRTCSSLSPEQLVTELNEVFAAFDDICRAHRMEKLKTIGDAFMCAGGLPVENQTHPIDAVEAAIEMQEYLEARSELPGKVPFKLRIGLHTGPVVAGVIGKWKFAYDIWGDAVNTASRMESSSAAGEINLSRSTYDRVRQHYICEPRGQVLAKGKGALEMFFVRGRRNAAA